MKRFLSYILIAFVVFWGFLANTETASAQVCWKNGLTVSGNAGQPMNQTECGRVGGTWQNPGAAVPPPPAGPSTTTVPVIPGSGTTTAPAVESPDDIGSCNRTGQGGMIVSTPNVKRKDCTGLGTFFILGTGGSGAAGTVTVNPPADDTTALERFANRSCTVLLPTEGCFLRFAYWLFYTIPSFFMWLSAILFNSLVAIGLSTGLYTESTFISTAWAIVRDLSNIFFILILLYVAVEMILGMGHGTKKTIANVLVMALLINFSMFFTKVVIDTGNIVALIFYNKLEVNTKSNGVTRPYEAGSNVKSEKDVSGGLMKAFDPTQTIDEKFFEAAKVTVVNGQVVNVNEVPFGIVFGVTVISGLIMMFAAYAFFVSGFTFLARLIELWVLIIFSPFALMSSTIGLLSGVPYIGWKQWLNRLIDLSFMAPIFMFFLYLIFLLVHADIFGNFLNQAQTKTQILLSVIIPAMVIIMLLMKATSFAKKASGELGGAMIGIGKMAMALGAGGAVLGTAALGRFAIGRTMASVSRTEGAMKRTDAIEKGRENYNTSLQRWIARGGVGRKPNEQQHIDREIRRAGPAASLPGAIIGARINTSQKKTSTITHEREEIAEAQKRAHLDGISMENLSGVQMRSVRKEFIKSKASSIEKDIRRGYEDDGTEILISENGVTAKGTDDYTAKRRSQVVADVQAAAMATGSSTSGDYDPTTGRLTDQGNKKVEDTLRKELSVIIDAKIQSIGEHKFEHAREEAGKRITVGDRITSLATGGSYDPRKLVGIQADTATGGTKGGMARMVAGFAAAKMISAVAAGVRMGMKNVYGTDLGKPKKDFTLDLKDTFTEALKNINLKIELPSGGGHGDHGHGGGHDDHGHAGAGGHH